jgi:hypothetical protein
MNGTSKDAGSGLSNDGINRGLQVALSNEWNQQWFYRWFCQMAWRRRGGSMVGGAVAQW